MFIPSCITNAVTKSPLDNDYFFNAESAWQRLSDIRNDKVTYINEDMAMLVNTCERYYKAFIQANNIPVPNYVMKESHSLVKLTELIELSICPLQTNMTVRDEKERYKFLKDFSDKYISCRYYNDQPTKEEFNACFDWVSKQRDLIISMIKDTNKDNTNHTDTFDDLD